MVVFWLLAIPIMMIIIGGLDVDIGTDWEGAYLGIRSYFLEAQPDVLACFILF